MQTANFRDQVICALAYKMGLDPVKDLLDDQARAYVSFINAWVRRIWPSFDWPEWTVIEERTPDASHYVDFAQPGELTIGRVMKVYLADPSTIQAILDTPFHLNSDGIHCGFEHGTTVWIKYIPAAPQYTSVPFVSTTTYAKNQVVYDPSGGNVYISLQDSNTGHGPVGTPTWWTVLPFPLELVELVVGGAYADALREDGQADKGALQEQGVLAELGLKIRIETGAAYDPMSDQSRPAPRYRLPGQIPTAAAGVT